MDAANPNKLRLELKAELAAELAALQDTQSGIDLLQAIGFLYGRRGSHGGVEYLKSGSFEERSSRQALARLLRGPEPLSRIVRHMLANLVDPQLADTRELLLKRRSKVRLPASIRDHDVAYFIAFRVENGKPMKVAKADALAHFDISTATMNRAWSKHGREMRRQAKLLLAELKKGYASRHC